MEQLGKDIGAQGDLVRKLKADKADKAEVTKAVTKLKELKEELKKMQDEAGAGKAKIKEFRAGFEDLLLRKFFYVPGFEIYGGVAGLYDFGPPGCAIKANLLGFWRQHFVLSENMLEVSCSAMTPEVVLKTSGHVEKFTDFMCKDTVTGDCHRGDKILEDHIDALISDPKKPVSKERELELLEMRTQADAYSQEDLGKVLKQLDVRAPDTGNELGPPFPFNLMFETSIGPTGKAVGYLRPETAQGIFVNFRRLLEYNGGRMPFAAAQIGLAFRNEISPRSGLLRVREFPLAEIEHFVHPDRKNHPKFKDVAEMKIQLLGRADQTGEDISRWTTAGDAVAQGIINNETLAYYMCRTHLFLVQCGIIPEKLRFRQHKSTEMAHYAKDCWDAEILMTYGWIECVGHADRSCYDLEQHGKVSKTDLSAQEMYETPKIVEKYVPKLNRGKIGKTFRKEAKSVLAALTSMDKETAEKMNKDLDSGVQVVKVCTGEEYKIERDMVSWSTVTEKISTEKYVPSVIEPSFGVGRILYGILEHSYTIRTKNGEEQSYLRLSPTIAPIKIAILPLGSNADFQKLVGELEEQFIDMGLSTKVDISGVSIGRKYARSDELGIPFDITIDFESFTENSVTVRDRDSTTQIRVKTSEVAMACLGLIKGRMTWAEAREKFPKFASPGDE